MTVQQLSSLDIEGRRPPTRHAPAAMVALAFVFGGPTAGCEVGEPRPTGPAALVNPFDWTALGPEDDPFADHRPVDVQCPADSYGGELFTDQYAFEVRTGADGCDWLSVSQPILAPVAAGDLVRVRVWHFELRADVRAEAHAALAIGGRTIWERRVAIPAEGGLLLDTVEAPRSWPAGTPLVFHLHNHGANTWNLLDVVARPEQGDGGL